MKETGLMGKSTEEVCIDQEKISLKVNGVKVSLKRNFSDFFEFLFIYACFTNIIFSISHLLNG